jgi:hypothetical protein
MMFGFCSEIMANFFARKDFRKERDLNQFRDAKRREASWTAVVLHRFLAGQPSVTDVLIGRRTSKCPATPDSLLTISLPLLVALCLAGATSAAERPKVDIPIRPLDASAAEKVSFTRDIKPLLVNNCYECHSAEDTRGDLDTTTMAGLLKAGKKAGPAVIPGKPDESAAVEYIRGLRLPQMPKGNPALSADELHLLRLWIFAGAKDDSANPPGKESPGAGSATASPSLKAGDDAATQKALAVLMFGGNAEEKLIAQRTLRMAWLPKPPAPPAVTASNLVFNPIDQFIVAKWQEAGKAEPTPVVCSDNVFLRRVYLDVIGLIPTVAEAERFLKDTASDKRVKLVDELLSRKEDYAANWTPFWEEALGSASVDKQGGIPTRGNQRPWIYKSFIANRPLDVMVAELIDPAMPGYQKPIVSEPNGKRVVSGYIQNESHNDTILTAANVSQVFLGTGMKCASCHSHFLNKEWPQARFLAFAGMFAADDLELIRCEKKSGQTIAAQFPFELPGVPNDVPKAVNERLHRLTQLLVDPTNPRFARTMVNRLWKRYFGIGLVSPVDDFRLDQPPSHPELLDWLADDFIRSGYDLKHTVRLLLTSRTYQLRYDPQLEDHFDIAQPTLPRYYRSPSLRRLTAEQLVDSIRLAMAQTLAPKQRMYLQDASTALTRALGKPASRNEISTSRPEDVAVVQALELLNGEEFHEIIYAGATLEEAAQASGATGAVNRLYWSALSRAPSAKEVELTARVFGQPIAELKKASGNRTTVEQVWIDDEVPAGGTSRGTGGASAWQWVSAPDPVLSGKRAHTQSGNSTAPSQHYFDNPKTNLSVGPKDTFFAYVYLDPKNPPQQIMLQWNDGTWDHRAYWGKNVIQFGAAGSASRREMGPLPRTGEWVRLEVPAREVGFMTPTQISGWSFDQAGGKVYWDKAGIARTSGEQNTEPFGDIAWALFSSPEFQYIR